ncbi:MAG: hypothetical protein QOG20_1520 [Pseudonocardiales bacterium]|jgi:hypothetical protein|nr:hypothetical protein [Pseudonocardiales bacterium]
MKLDASELRAQKLSAEHHAEVKRDLQVRGYAVLEKVIPDDKLEQVRSGFFERLAANVRQVGDNRGKQRQGGVPLPIEEPFTDPEIMANPLALDVYEDLLGADIACSYFSSDTPLPGSEYQPAHRDGQDLFPGLAVTLPAYMYEINIPLVDFREDNGPVEIWPFSHLVNGFSLGNPRALEHEGVSATQTEVQDYTASLSPQPVLMPAGSLLLRDPRMWHRGTPNRSDEPRPMLSLAYHRPWYRFNSVTLSGEVYRTMPERMQRLFRLATIDGETSRDFS